MALPSMLAGCRLLSWVRMRHSRFWKVPRVRWKRTTAACDTTVKWNWVAVSQSVELMSYVCECGLLTDLCSSQFSWENIHQRVRVDHHGTTETAYPCNFL